MNIDEIIKAAQKECLHEWHGPCLDLKSRYYICKICGAYLRDMEYDYKGKNNPTKKIKKDEIIKEIQKRCTHTVWNKKSINEAHNQIKREWVDPVVKKDYCEIENSRRVCVLPRKNPIEANFSKIIGERLNNAFISHYKNPIKNKSKKDGKKKRAGRPSLPPDMKKQTLTIRLRPTILSWLDRKSMNRKISRSKFIEEILEDWAIIND